MSVFAVLATAGACGEPPDSGTPGAAGLLSAQQQCFSQRCRVVRWNADVAFPPKDAHHARFPCFPKRGCWCFRKPRFPMSKAAEPLPQEEDHFYNKLPRPLKFRKQKRSKKGHLRKEPVTEHGKERETKKSVGISRTAFQTTLADGETQSPRLADKASN